MESPFAFQRFPLPKLVFIAEKAKKKENQVLVVTPAAVKCDNSLFLHKDNNADPVNATNVDRKKQSLMFEDVM